ncbi:hypothetical protein, partial [Streptomyces sp. NPDC047000]|uniref:hypothetical protein n=1 Tax=Streptomyces sp. NPDC047000 TaxID=3155474 RepID=UPI0033DA3654
YLALIFGTLLSSQGTDASFVLTLSGFPPGFPSASKSTRSFSDPISSALSRFSLFRAISFPALPTLSEVLSRVFRPFREGLRQA